MKVEINNSGKWIAVQVFDKAPSIESFAVASDPGANWYQAMLMLSGKVVSMRFDGVVMQGTMTINDAPDFKPDSIATNKVMFKIDEDECPPHNFIEVQFIEEDFKRKFCTKCGIHPVRIPEGTKLYAVHTDGSETLIPVDKHQ